MENKSCFVVGEGTLAVRCGDILLKHGYSIRGVITAEESLQSWATKHRIPQRKFAAGLLNFMGKEPFDYLFSIFNVHILRPEILGLPRLGAINYHDALLPRYAGLYAPSWAILNRETKHGITWHRMVDQVDEGEILSQRSFEIFPDDTALTLNQRCFDAAVTSFDKLLLNLAAHGVKGVPQDLSQRTYYPREQRPEAACTLDFNKSAEALVAQVKALDFGPFRNPLGLSKIVVEDGFLCVSEASIGSYSPQPAGTVIAADQERLIIATSTLPVILGGLTTLDGKPLSSTEIQDTYGVAVGTLLPELRTEERERITATNSQACLHEAFWISRLRSLKPLSLGERLSSDTSPTLDEFHFKWTIPKEVDSWILNHGSAEIDRQTFLLAAFGGYLARVQGEESFDVSLSIKNPGLDLCRGLFAQSVPFRYSVDLSESFLLLIQAVRDELASLRGRYTYARDLVARDPELTGKQALFEFGGELQIIFSEQLTGNERLVASDMTIVFPKHGSEGVILFNRGRLNEGSIQREIRQFEIFLKSLTEDPTQSVAQVPLMSEEELLPLLPVEKNSSYGEGDNSSLLELFDQQVTRSPNSIAVESADSQLTYAQLDQASTELAFRLRSKGIGPEKIVGIYLKRSPQAIIALWGVLKSGGAFLVLDPSTPKLHTDSILRDARPKIVLATPDSVMDLDEMGGAEWMDIAPPLTPEEQQVNPLTASNESGLAYVIYTSGSTGQPKGVMIEHGALLNFCSAVKERFALLPSDRVLQFASLSFDACIEEIFPCLLAGGTLVLRTEEMIQSPVHFLKACEASSITILDLPTVYWIHLTNGMEHGEIPLPSSVRMVVIGGEAANIATLRTWREVLKIKVPLLNTYGPTETTVTAIWCDLTGRDIVHSGNSIVPIGKPLPYVAACVLDKQLKPVPLGAVGELCISGRGVARGYLNRDELTAEKFVHAPSKFGPGPRMYRTGDKVRYRSDGNLEFLGRLDNQVKIRGFRVEVEEIEATLLNHPEVENCCVVVKSNQRGEDSLQAFVTSHDLASFSAASCRERLRKRLPDYMIPEKIICVESFPQTKGGKIDRRSLVSLGFDDEDDGSHYHPPVDDLESELIAIWQDAFQRKDIGTRNNFFELGGHSLLAVILTSRMSLCLNHQIPLSCILRYPTIQEIAREIRSAQIQPKGPTPKTSFLEEGNHVRSHFALECSGSNPQELLPVTTKEPISLSNPLQKWRNSFSSQGVEQILPLRAEGGKTPLFILPGGTAGENEVMTFAAMLPYFPSDLPLYGLIQDFSKHSNKGRVSVAKIARNFWVEIKKVQPKGPYNIMAECISSVTALEMARQAKLAGESIDRLILLEPHKLHRGRFWRLLQRVNRMLRVLSGKPTYRHLPKGLQRYFHMLEREKPVRYGGTLYILAFGDEIKLRNRLDQWGAFKRAELVISCMPGNHASYVLECRELVARKIGTILESGVMD